jgi:fatty acid-binding protein DegV
MAYLERLGLINASQAFVGEMLAVQQLFYLNAGTLIPVQKIRNSRHLVESMLEFVAEFADPQRVALQQAATGYHQEARTIRERLTQEYPEVGINELSMTLPLAALFGPQSLGLFLWEISI